MSTRSTYGILNGDNTVTAVYCHFDGYLSGVGYTLLNNYDTEDKIRNLLSFGACSGLGKTIDESIFYTRDREEDLEIKTYGSVSDFCNCGSYYEYHYLFDTIKNRWFVRDDGGKLVELSSVSNNEKSL
jgi:hypothetical protein